MPHKQPVGKMRQKLEDVKKFLVFLFTQRKYTALFMCVVLVETLFLLIDRFVFLPTTGDTNATW